MKIHIDITIDGIDANVKEEVSKHIELLMNAHPELRTATELKSARETRLRKLEEVAGVGSAPTTAEEQFNYVRSLAVAFDVDNFETTVSDFLSRLAFAATLS